MANLFSRYNYLGEGFGIMRKFVDYLNGVSIGRVAIIPEPDPRARRNA